MDKEVLLAMKGMQFAFNENTGEGVLDIEEGKQNLTSYQTPFGSLMIGINTHKVEVTEHDECIHLEAQYGLDINYEFLSDCVISMDISPKNKLDLS